MCLILCSLFSTWLWVIVFLSLEYPLSARDHLPELQEGANSGNKITCETLPSSIHVTKEEYDELGNVIRACEGAIAVSKCEGTCLSQVQPSVVTPSGFLKECHCCRESWMRQREILLTECYGPDGQRFFGQQGTMVIHLKEPESCTCHKCGT